MAFVTFIWNGFAFAVLCAPQYSDSAIDHDAGLFNYAIVIMTGITAIAVEEWWRKSHRVWFENLKDLNNNSPESEVETFNETKVGSVPAAPASGV